MGFIVYGGSGVWGSRGWQSYLVICCVYLWRNLYWDMHIMYLLGGVRLSIVYTALVMNNKR
jgi:hypothetical protein